MSILLYVVGAVAVMLGVGMAAWGVPINEFSFGNTLIVSGITMASGGLIVVGLGAVVSQLHRVAEALAMRNAIAEHHAFEPPPEAPVANEPAARVPFAARPLRTEPALREPSAPPVPAPLESDKAAAAAPSLPNPEAPPFAFDEEVLLSPQPPAAEPPPEDLATPPPRLNGGGARQEPSFEPPRSPPRETLASSFDNMWPAEPEPPRAGAKPEPEPKFEPKFEPLGETPASAPERKPEAAATPPKRDVAILKSGVVDGMAYTLYVDGSIEAELPQGTLHFASIEELRGHLEKNSSST